MNTYEDDAPTHVQGEPAGQPQNKDQKTAIGAAVVSTAALGGAAVVMSKFFMDEETPPHKHETDPKPVAQNPVEQNPVAQNPVEQNPHPAEPKHDHPQTFSEAFAEARAAHGGEGGGYFEFDRDGDGKKEYYSTYLDSEWEDLSHKERQDFYATVPGHEMHHDNAGQVPFSNSGGSMLSGGEISTPHNDVPPPVDEAEITIDDEHHSNVVAVNHVEENNSVAVEDPTPETHDTSKADYAIAEIDGHHVVVIDIDNDNRPDGIYNPDNDIIVMDTDGDHVLDTRAVVEHDHFTHMEHLDSQITIDGNMDVLHQTEQEHHPAPEQPESMLADNDDLGADYDNHADISDYDYS